jgi:hypothetical protein
LKDRYIGLEDEMDVPLRAVEDMCAELDLEILVICPQDYLSRMAGRLSKTKKQIPDWAIAGMNCKNERDILPICIQVYLSDWRPE